MVNIITQNDQYITIDGHRFHHVWIRDNCLCDKCCHPTSLQRLSNISDVSSSFEPVSIREENGELSIAWNEETPHESVFPISWLLDNRYDNSFTDGNEPKKTDVYNLFGEQVLWNKAWIDENKPIYHDVNATNRDPWMTQLFTLGFVVVNKFDVDNFESFLSSFGPIYHTEFGAFVPTKVQMGANDLAETNHALSFHTDYPYWVSPPLMTCLYSVKPADSGGESVLIDGFRIISDFQQDHPNYFDVLAKTRIQFRQLYKDWGYYYSCKRSILEVDEQGTLVRLNYAPSHSYEWDLPFEQMGPFYEAYMAFSRYMNKPEYQYTFLLESQHCVLINNSRVLHARKAFQGTRHLNAGWISWDFIAARQNYKQFTHPLISA